MSEVGGYGNAAIHLNFALECLERIYQRVFNWT